MTLNDKQKAFLTQNNISDKDVVDVDVSQSKVTFIGGIVKTVCEVWTRVMGYHRPFSEYNKGKKSEFLTRKCFTEEHAKRGCDKC